MLERTFELEKHATNVRIELLAGLTTFMTMAYIIFVNPAILADAGMDKGAVFVATCLAAAFGFRSGRTAAPHVHGCQPTARHSDLARHLLLASILGDRRPASYCPRSVFSCWDPCSRACAHGCFAF